MILKIISSSYGLTIIKFSEYWKINNYDLVFCLGDRFEMVPPFNLEFLLRLNLPIFVGETTLGAIDNVYEIKLLLLLKFICFLYKS